MCVCFVFLPFGALRGRVPVEGTPAALFVLGVRLLTGCLTSTRHLATFLGGRRGDKQANTPSIEMPYLLYYQRNTRLYGSLCIKEACTPLELQLKRKLV